MLSARRRAGAGAHRPHLGDGGRPSRASASWPGPARRWSTTSSSTTSTDPATASGGGTSTPSRTRPLSARGRPTVPSDSAAVRPDSRWPAPATPAAPLRTVMQHPPRRRRQRARGRHHGPTRRPAAGPARPHRRAAPAEEIGFDSERWGLRQGRVVDFQGQRALEGTAYLDGPRLRERRRSRSTSRWTATAAPGSRSGRRTAEPGAGLPAAARARPLGRPPVHPGLQRRDRLAALQRQGLHGRGRDPARPLPQPPARGLRDRAPGSSSTAARPALVVNASSGALGGGSVGLVAPPGGAVHFARFRVTPMDVPRPRPGAGVGPPPGVITDLAAVPRSRGTPSTAAACRGTSPSSPGPRSQAAPSGLVDVARALRRRPSRPRCSPARRGRPSARRCSGSTFGYSDQVSVFCNGELLFSGDSSYRRRDPEFKGIVGPFDASRSASGRGATSCC